MPPGLQKRHKLYLLKNYDRDITGVKLPSIDQVLRFLLYNVHGKNESASESAKKVFKKLMIFWAKANIPIIDRINCDRKILKLHGKWTALRKNKHRRTVKQITAESDFKNSLDNVFNIAHQNALNMITLKEDRNFLLQQRKPGRPGSFASKDAIFQKKESKKTAREARYQKFAEKETLSKKQVVQTVESPSNASTS